MNWGNQQNSALSQVDRWLKDPHGAQIFRLFGYAGTGKTTLAKHIAEGITGTVLYAAYTGKASLVLRKKGCLGASTIHSLIYTPKQNKDTGEYIFELNSNSAAAYAALIIVDEVSMVGEELAMDLLSYGTRLLVLGDPHQLPPVQSEGFFINATPDVMLTEVHRQAQENPIIRMSMDVREGRGLKHGQYGTSLVIPQRQLSDDRLHDLLMKSDQLLIGTNKSRQLFNTYIRDAIGLNPDRPDVADRLVCLRNNRDKNLLNGELWEVKTVKTSRHTYDMEAQSVDTPTMSTLKIRVPPAFFMGTEKDMDWRERKKYDEFTYGWALTVHKAQGSEWNRVLLMDESRYFRDDASKHLYTGITRASDSITVVV